MFDVGGGELVIIGVVALIVIGPKDLPEMFRTLGRFTGKLRSMARDFQRAMESAADEAGVKDVAKDLKAATSTKSLGLDAVKEAAAKFEKWDPLKPAAARPAPRSAAGAAAASAATATAPATTADATDAAVTPSMPLGPNTQALSDKVAAARATAVETAEAIRQARAAPAAPVPETPGPDA
jgi:sec-independent protein translocase protein TatB